jgi:hypothetical protein
MSADTICGSSATAFSISPASLASPNASTAVLFLAMTSASMPVPRINR